MTYHQHTPEEITILRSYHFFQQMLKATGRVKVLRNRRMQYLRRKGARK